MTEPFPNFTNARSSHSRGCDTKGCINTKKLKDNFCKDCEDTDKLSNQFLEIKELTDIIHRKTIEYNKRRTQPSKDEIDMLQLILVALKKK